MTRQSGFTLIEIIVTLVLVGIMGLIAGLGIVQGVQGYLFAKENVTISQQAQLALSRIHRELEVASTVSACDASAGDSSITFVNNRGGRTIDINANGELQLTVTGDGGGTYPLMENVGDFTLGCFKHDDGDGDPIWNTGDASSDLYYITVDLSALRDDDNPAEQFSTSINPRNTNLFRGPYYRP